MRIEYGAKLGLRKAFGFVMPGGAVIEKFKQFCGMSCKGSSIPDYGLRRAFGCDYICNDSYCEIEL